MLCAPDPCECFAPKAKKPAPRKRPAVEAVPEEVAPQPAAVEPTAPRQDLRAKMKAAATKAPSFAPVVTEQPKQRKVKDNGFMEPTPPPTRAPAPRPVKTDEQLLLEAALRAVGPIMSHADREQYHMIINSVPSPAERKAEWRARRSWQLSS